ncbi:MAG: protein kinase domain-containing protein, partial [Myxococcota bacterium]
MTQTWRKASWLGTAPRITPAHLADAVSSRLEVANVFGGWLALGVLLQVGFTCLLVFALDRRRVPYLWFGVQAVTASSYPLYIAGLTVPVLGTLDVPFIELGLIVALTASLYFTHSFFNLGPVPRWLNALMALSGVISLVIVDPFWVVDVAVRFVVASVTVCIVYQLTTIGRLWWQRPDSRLALALLGGGWLALAGTTWCDLLHWFLAIEPLDGMRPACFGLALFGLFLSLLLSRAHILSLSQADDLNANLSRQVAEVAAARNQLETVNRELRRQIADRSAQLFAALSLSHGRLDDGPVELGIGAEINGRYRIEEMLGAGAMGTVYRVTRLSDGARLAMKVTSELQGAALARLAREAHILSRLRHDNVVHILDIDVATNGFMYVILELVEGASLRVFLRERGTMSATEAIPVLRQIALGLAALHEANIAHRDLKPDNVLLTPTAAGMHVKIADFGISRLDASTATDGDAGQDSAAEEGGDGVDDGTAQLRVLRESRVATETALRSRPSSRRVDSVGLLLEELDDDATEDAMALPVNLDEGTGRLALGTSQDRTAAVRRPRPPNAPEPTPRLSTGSMRTGGTATPSSLDLTGTGALSGTPHYIAPELARSGSPNDVRADLYSFGVLAYELLVGKRPFGTPIAVLLMHAEPKRLPPPPALPSEHAILAPLVS